jgi:hypothetical protein
MPNNMRDPVDLLQWAERERLPLRPAQPVELPTIHYTELPEDSSGGVLAAEWNFYRREVARLLADGHEGRWVLIKAEDIVGIWDTEGEADQVRVRRFPGQPVLLKQICEREPVLRGGGYQYGWHR